MEDYELQSIQVKLIRQIQASEGFTVCYATNVAIDCTNKTCLWRHDCLDDSLCQVITSTENYGASLSAVN
jgi:hypothetical protein